MPLRTGTTIVELYRGSDDEEAEVFEISYEYRPKGRYEMGFTLFTKITPEPTPPFSEAEIDYIKDLIKGEM